MEHKYLHLNISLISLATALICKVSKSEYVSELTLLVVYLKYGPNPIQQLLLSEFSARWCLVRGSKARIVTVSVWNEIEIGQAKLRQNFSPWHPFCIMRNYQASLINRVCRKISYRCTSRRLLMVTWSHVTQPQFAVFVSHSVVLRSASLFLF